MSSKVFNLSFLMRRSIVTWFGCGLIPKAPGTAGTLGTVPLAWWLSLHFDPDIRLAVAFLLTGFACVMVGWDQIENEIKDPQYVVLDETVGLLWSSAFLPRGLFAENGKVLLLTFVFFRLFDVVKPFPARSFDRASKTALSPWTRGCHIVLDDVVAGLYTAAIMALIGVLGYLSS